MQKTYLAVIAMSGFALSSGAPAAAQSRAGNDILWHNGSTGETQIWHMNGHAVTSRATVIAENGSNAMVGTPWAVVGTADMNGDGKPDIVWHNSATGATQLWHIDGNRIIARVNVVGESGALANVGAPWRIAATGDFNGDRNLDLLWHNGTTGESQVWNMSGHKVSARTMILGEDGSVSRVGAPWNIVAAHDMNGDGHPDITWYNGSTGETQIWHTVAHRVTGRAVVLGENGSAVMIGAPWRIVGSRDFSNDGRSDFLWHNGTTGESQVWQMDGFRVIGRATVLGENGAVAKVGAPWSIVGTNDFALSTGAASGRASGATEATTDASTARASRVPDVTGLPWNEAESSLRSAGFDVTRVFEDEPDASVRLGHVRATEPAAGTVAAGVIVKLMVPRAAVSVGIGALALTDLVRRVGFDLDEGRYEEVLRGADITLKRYENQAYTGEDGRTYYAGAGHYIEASDGAVIVSAGDTRAISQYGIGSYPFYIACQSRLAERDRAPTRQPAPLTSRGIDIGQFPTDNMVICVLTSKQQLAVVQFRAADNSIANVLNYKFHHALFPPRQLSQPGADPAQRIRK